MLNRIQNLRELLTENNLDGLLVTQPANRRYLSGFTGTTGSILVTKEEAILLVDFRYTEQARSETEGLEIKEFQTKQINALTELIEELELSQLGFESNHMNYNQYLTYKKELDVEFKATQNLVKKIRLAKEDSEIKKIKQAVALADQAWAQIKDWIKPGLTEQEVSLKLEFLMKEAGASDKAFDFIVASGKRSSLPHGVASDKQLQSGELLMLDFGCVVNGYYSDMTRTVVIGQEPTKKQTEIYELVLMAQKQALSAIEAGKKGSEIDQVARDIIIGAGYGDNFGHGLGHGVGLEIHEGPKLSRQDDTVLKPGMVVTVEPGVYLPDWGGVRIEDLVVVKENGCDILTDSSKKLEVIDN